MKARTRHEGALSENANWSREGTLSFRCARVWRTCLVLWRRCGVGADEGWRDGAVGNRRARRVSFRRRCVVHDDTLLFARGPSLVCSRGDGDAIPAGAFDRRPCVLYPSLRVWKTTVVVERLSAEDAPFPPL